MRRLGYVTAVTTAAAGAAFLVGDLIRGKGVSQSARELLATGAVVWLGNNLAFALFHDGQYAAALEEANTLESPPLGLLIACDAQLNGVTHALAEAQRRSSTNTSFKQIAAQAGQARRAAWTAESTSASPPAEISAIEPSEQLSSTDALQLSSTPLPHVSNRQLGDTPSHGTRLPSSVGSPHSVIRC